MGFILRSNGCILLYGYFSYLIKKPFGEILENFTKKFTKKFLLRDLFNYTNLNGSESDSLMKTFASKSFDN